jgi:hypothetical protein
LAARQYASMRWSSSGERGPVSAGFMVLMSQSSIVEPRETMECRCAERPGGPENRSGKIPASD